MDALVAVALLVVGSIFSAAPASPEPAGGDFDRRFLAVEERVPGFGGAYVEGDATVGEKETLHIWLVEPNDGSLQMARDVLREIIGGRYSAESAVPHRATFAFSELWRWKASATELMGRHGVNLVDIDERRNRLLVGVDQRSGDQDAAMDELVRRGIPRQAVELAEVDGFTPLPSEDKGTIPLLVAGAAVALVLGLLVLKRQHRRRSAPTAP